MIARTAILTLLPIVAVIALTQRRRLTAIVGMGLFSFLLAVAYLLLHAPDVALTEATIGLGLITAIYVLAIRRTGRLAVVADEADVGAGGWVRGEEVGVLVTRPHLDTALFTVGEGEGETVEDLPRVQYEGYFADLDPQSLYTAKASVTLDLARFLAVRWSDVPDAFVTRHPQTRGYAFVVSERRRDLHSALEAYIERLRETGELDRLTKRFLA